MQRGLLRFSINPGLPPLVHRHPGGAVLAPLGRWLSERVASQVPDWPALGFHRIEITTDGIELLLVTGRRVNAATAFGAVLEAIRLDTEGAARRSGWGTDRLWREATLSLEEARPRPRPTARLRPDPDQQHDGEREEDAIHRPRGEVV